LPVPEAHRVRSVAVQNADSDSTLHAARAFLRWRKQQPALVHGSIRFLDAPEPLLAFVRESADERLLLVFNLSAVPARWAAPANTSLLAIPGFSGVTHDGENLHLPARSVALARVGGSL
jgi:alpha-glucosidase